MTATSRREVELVEHLDGDAGLMRQVDERLAQLLQSLQLGLLKTFGTRSWADSHNPPRISTVGAADVCSALDANKLLMLD